MTTVIVYGPPACGKTRNAQAIAHSFGCHVIVDGWDHRHHRLTLGALHLTNVRPPRDRVDPGVVLAFETLALERLRHPAQPVPTERPASRRWPTSPVRPEDLYRSRGGAVGPVMSGPRDTMAAAWADDGLDRLPLGAIAMLAGVAIWASAMLANWLLPVGGAA